MTFDLSLMMLNRLRRHLEKRRFETYKRDLVQTATDRNLGSVRTLCLALGPYRSYTTVTAGYIGTHPHCLALNHGGSSVIGDPELDFIAHRRPQVTDNFLRYALALADHGLPHEAKLRPLRRRLPRAAGDGFRREPRVIFWNDAQRMARHLRRHNVHFDELFRKEPRLRFLLTLRNPIDCAASLVHTGLTRHLQLEPGASLQTVLEAVLREFHWFATLEKRHPDRFFHLAPTTFDPDQAQALARFLGVEADPAWIARATKLFHFEQRRFHDSTLTAQCRQAVERYFENLPEFGNLLLGLLSEGSPSS